MSAPPLMTPTFRSKHLTFISCGANWKVLAWYLCTAGSFGGLNPSSPVALQGRLENPKPSSPAHRPPPPTSAVSRPTALLGGLYTQVYLFDC